MKPTVSESFEAEQYRAFIANSAEGIWRFETGIAVPTDLSEHEQIDLFYCHSYLAECNDAFARMYGHETGKELVGTRLGDFLPRDTPENTAYLLAFVRAGYRLADAESVEADKNGGTKHFLNSLVGVVENGTLVRVWGTQRDITPQREAETRLTNSLNLLSAIAHSTTDAVFVKNTEGRYLFVNESVARAVGKPISKIVGSVDADIFPHDVAEVVRANDLAVMRSGKTLVTEEMVPLPDGGAPHYFLATKSPYHDATSRRIVGVIAISRDITDRKAMETERIEAATRQRRFLSEMLAGFTEGRLRLCFGEDEMPSPLPPESDPLDLTPTSLRLLRKHIEVVTEGLNFPKERLADLLTASHEAAMNAVRHGGGGTARIHGDHETGMIQVWVADNGPGIAEEMIHRAVEQGFTTGGFGQGFFYMQSCADRLYLLTTPHGTTAVLEMERTPPEPAWLRRATR